MFGSLLYLQLLEDVSCFIRYLRLFGLTIVVSNTFSVMFFVVFPRMLYPMLLVSLDCPFLIAPSVFSNVYLFIN